ncbi:MAG: potassium channel family protein [Spirochaetota bacterium]
MKQFAVIGLGFFGLRVLEELLHYDVEVMVLDRDSVAIEAYKDMVGAAYVVDIIREDIIQELVPSDLDAAIVDLGKHLEASILVTNYLKKHGVRRIVAKAETEQHGEILNLVGATEVVFPNREAAKRIALPLISASLFNFVPIGTGLVMAEFIMPEELHGKTLVEADLRGRYRLNVIAARPAHYGEYAFVDPGYVIRPDEMVLVAGSEQDIAKLSGHEADKEKGRMLSGVKKALGWIFRQESGDDK